jgi:hypothetical protein
MKKLVFSLALALSIVPAAARAQVGVHIDIGLPVAPPLVVVQPGIQVVEGFNEEVFFSGGWYWCRRGNAWYRARTPQAHFVWVDSRHVPMALQRVPAGRYRNWHRAEVRAERHEVREHERAVHEERREEHEHR